MLMAEREGALERARHGECAGDNALERARQGERAGDLARLGEIGSASVSSASSLLSSRWSYDSLVTFHPARLYDGSVTEVIDLDVLEAVLEDLRALRGPVRSGAVRMGVFTWDIACDDGRAPFVLQVPLVLDEPGSHDRAKRDVPRRNVEAMRHFIAQGLGRFVVEPGELLTLRGNVPAAVFPDLPDHRPVKFGRGSIQIELSEGKPCWLIALGPQATAEVLAEIVAALTYHYEPDRDGGTAVTDIAINDGDFVAVRRTDGSFALKLKALRRREGGIGTSRLLLYFLQLMAYEDFGVDGNLTGLPLLVSNPSVTFEGVVRGLTYRYRDLGREPDEGKREAERWIAAFGRSREGRSYRPWVDRFLAGGLPLSFGSDLRERWWRLMPLQTKLGVLELRARHEPNSGAVASARAFRSFLERISREIGRVPDDDPSTIRINDLGLDGLLGLLEEAEVSPDARPGIAEEILARWPYRSFDHLLARVPSARSLRRLKSRLSFGHVVPDKDQGTLRSLEPLPKEPVAARPLANPEIFGPVFLPALLHEAAARTFPTFEAYMDAALHDPRWGYYAHQVVIGEHGHFDTHPEEHSPDYGRWIATVAFRAWCDMVEKGELSAGEPFPIVEFGAGNGRLARDVLDFMARAPAEPELAERDRWHAFTTRVEYRIYETSASLRDKQRRLLGPRALVAEGDARHPGATLARDFPAGLRGFVVTNEVPDAFGVHKVVLARDGRAHAVLVVPRVEPALRDVLGDELRHRAAEVDARVRDTFGLRENERDLYLDSATYADVMADLMGFPTEEREAHLSGLRFEEALVAASAIPDLAAHLANNAREYATALAAEDSGVVTYVNVHADRFIGELGSALKAGFIVTIDYGETTWGLVVGARRGDFPFRVYGDQKPDVPRPNDPYAAPGTQDMTADVNFTALARAGAAAGLSLVHFGPERDVAGERIPALLARATTEDRVARFIGNPLFKVLVLGTRPSGAFDAPLMTPLPLSARDQDIPKSRRSLVPTLEKALVSPAED